MALRKKVTTHQVLLSFNFNVKTNKQTNQWNFTRYIYIQIFLLRWYSIYFFFILWCIYEFESISLPSNFVWVRFILVLNSRLTLFLCLTPSRLFLSVFVVCFIFIPFVYSFLKPMSLIINFSVNFSLTLIFFLLETPLFSW